MRESLDIESPDVCGGGWRGCVSELQQIERSEIARGIVEEHVFRARIGGADLSRRRAGMPVVDRGVELDAGISRCPGGIADLVPQVARLERLRRLAGQPRDEAP